MNAALRLCTACSGLLIASIGAAEQRTAPQWVTQGPKVQADQFTFELPLEVVATKLFVSVELGGQARRFVFDTGSPSMIDARLADELGLVEVGNNVGRDAHGALVESRIMQADLTLGGVLVEKVPIYAADFSQSEAAACLVGDGVLGSELLPLCAWQIDLPNRRLRCATDLRELDHVAGAERLNLHDFGYPHAPIFDIQLAKKANSKAMFDTGAPDYLVLAQPDFEGAKRNRGIGETRSGFGSAGGSLGGQAPDAKLTRVELKTLAIDQLKLGRIWTTLRPQPPTLIGAAFLEHFVVTLDQRSGSAYFDAYQSGPYEKPGFGFTLAFQSPLSVAAVWDDSAAAEAGLRAGTPLQSINGKELTAGCDSMRYALEAMGGAEVSLVWDGGAATLRRRY